MNEANTALKKRIICPRCLCAERACICACVKRIASPIELLILQHTDEVHHIKNSARLLHLCLSNSALMVGSSFDENLLVQALCRDAKQPVLLYPESPDQPQLQGKPTTPDWRDPSKLRLIVIDATWRKSRQILAQHACLRRLPRLALSDVPTSQYLIRREHEADQLSTLEAACYALMQLDYGGNYSAMLEAFAAFNQMQLAFGVHRLHR